MVLIDTIAVDVEASEARNALFTVEPTPTMPFHGAPESYDPRPRPDRQLGSAHGGRTSGMRGKVQLCSFFCCHSLVDVFMFHNCSAVTRDSNCRGAASKRRGQNPVCRRYRNRRSKQLTFLDWTARRMHILANRKTFQFGEDTRFSVSKLRC